MLLRKNIGLIIILLLASFLRFYGLMHDSPYFFNPDERNMASAITQFRLPNSLPGIFQCVSSEFFSSYKPTTNNLQPTTNCTLNPHFFAYGQFPLYLAYISDQISQPFNHLTIKPSVDNLQPTTYNLQLTTSFSSAIYWLRFWSALTSTITVLLVYKIVKLLFNSNSRIKNYVLRIKPEYFAALLTAFIPGLIQSAHFGTTESLLTFFFLCSLYFSIKLFNKDGSRVKPGMTKGVNSKFLILTSILCGLAIGSKMTGLFFLVPACLAIGFNFLGQKKKTKRDFLFQAFTHLRILAFFIIITAFIAILSSPYNLVEPEHFQSAVFGYESDVARGKFEAFYTRQFVNTTPLLFQFEKIFPYALGIVLTVAGTIGFLLMISSLLSAIAAVFIRRIKNQESRIRERKKIKLDYFLLNSCFMILASFLVYFIPNAFLFAKWSRFMTPILPFFVIFAIYVFSVIPVSPVQQDAPRIRLGLNTDSGHPFTLFRVARMTKQFLLVICYLLFVISLIQGLAFFSIYTREDSRFLASRWIYKNIPSNAYILSETANVIDIPIPPPSPAEASAKEGNQQPSTINLQPISFDFYHLDENPELPMQLISHLEKADYIFIPSRRIFANYTRIPDGYPILKKYYENLFNGNLGFEKIAEISSYPSLCILIPDPCPLNFPDEKAEETFTVFDHPVIRIYKKVTLKISEDYSKMLLLKS